VQHEMNYYFVMVSCVTDIGIILEFFSFSNCIFLYFIKLYIIA